MTKARTRAARRRAVRGRAITLPGGATVDARPSGRDRWQTNQREPADAAALEARARHQRKEVTRETLRDMRAPWWGCEAGKAMASAVDEDERPDLWDAIQHIRRVVAAYDAALGAPRRHAKCLRLLVPPDALAADSASPAADTRTDAERLRHAVSAWMALHVWLCWVDKPAAGVCMATVVDDAPCRDPAGLVRALRCVSDGIRGRQMLWRRA